MYEVILLAASFIVGWFSAGLLLALKKAWCDLVRRVTKSDLPHTSKPPKDTDC